MIISTRNDEGNAPSFPALYSLGRSLVILATGHHGNNTRELIGTVVATTVKVWKVGDFSQTWNADDFKRFDGSVTLKNSD